MVGDLYKEFKDRGSDNSRAIVGADDSKNFKVNVKIIPTFLCRSIS